MEPGVPGFGIAEGADVSPSRDERLLDRVLGAVHIPKDEGGDGELPIHRSTRQLGEGIVIA